VSLFEYAWIPYFTSNNCSYCCSYSLVSQFERDETI
jgi:hypothetical protein